MTNEGTESSESKIVESEDLKQDDQRQTAVDKRLAEFTTENHKLEIFPLPRNVKYHVVQQLLERHFKLSPHKIRVGERRAYVAFKSLKERDDAIARIDNQEWKDRTLCAKPADPRHDPFIKRARVDADEQSRDDAAGDETEVLDDAKINSQVCPFWDKSYEDQLKFKDSNMRSVLNIGKRLLKIIPKLKNESPKLYEWTQKNSEISCQFDGVEPSPCLIGYRNKCEFNVGADGTVGFKMGQYKRGSERVVSPPQNCPIINKNMFPLIEILQGALQDTKKSKLRGFDQVTHEGNVRQLTIRTNQKDECLVIIDMHPQSLTEAEVDQEINTLVELLKSITNVISIYFNISDKGHLLRSGEKLKLVYGETHLHELLAVDQDSPLKFRIGPISFFQVNTKAAEILYRSIKEVAQLDSKSLVLDVGCGTGTIGLSLAKQVSYVIGIEIVESAISDAKINAQENEINNVTFFAGKAEELIGESICILKSKLSDQNNEGEIVAIVDPPRTGFNTSFIKSIRASNIKKIIYVACDPKANENLVALCRPTSKAYQGAPFVPTRAKAFDLFPHTKFCELVLVYERL